MNKKLLVGCLGLVLVGILLGSMGFYFFVYRPASDYLGSLAQVSEISEMNDQVENQSSYTPPDDGVLQESQVESFVRVQRRIVEQMGPHLEELNKRYSNLGADLRNGQRVPGISEIVSIWNDLRGTILLAKEAQVEALNAENLSREEYRWIRNRFYEAVGTNLVSVNLERVAEAVQKRQPEILTEQSQPEATVPPRNRELVEPYEEEAKQWVAYAWIGL